MGNENKDPKNWYLILILIALLLVSLFLIIVNCLSLLPSSQNKEEQEEKQEEGQKEEQEEKQEEGQKEEQEEKQGEEQEEEQEEKQEEGQKEEQEEKQGEEQEEEQQQQPPPPPPPPPPPSTGADLNWDNSDSKNETQNYQNIIQGFARSRLIQEINNHISDDVKLQGSNNQGIRNLLNWYSYQTINGNTLQIYMEDSDLRTLLRGIYIAHFGWEANVTWNGPNFEKLGIVQLTNIYNYALQTLTENNLPSTNTIEFSYTIIEIYEVYRFYNSNGWTSLPSGVNWTDGSKAKNFFNNPVNGNKLLPENCSYLEYDIFPQQGRNIQMLGHTIGFKLTRGMYRFVVNINTGVAYLTLTHYTTFSKPL